MSFHPSSKWKSESGQAAVEFALVLPLLLVVLLGAVDFGIAFTTWNDAQHLANSGARFAAVGRSPEPGSTLQNALKAQADVKSPMKVCVTFYDDSGNPTSTPVKGDPVKVEVSTTYKWLPVPYVTDVTDTQIGGRATMRLETAPDPAVVPSGCV
jgi:Flp pilus assembly protein TadG